MTFRSRIVLPLLVLALLAGFAPASAQEAVAASMTVLLPPTSGAGVRPITFGVVTLGVTNARTIETEADSIATGIGAFNFTGVNGNRDVQLTFDLPAALTHAASGSSMPITFNGNHGLHCFNRRNGVHACTLFNPSPGGANPSVILIDPPAPPRDGVVRVYLGGSVTPPTSLPPGTYQGTVTLTLSRL